MSTVTNRHYPERWNTLFQLFVTGLFLSGQCSIPGYSLQMEQEYIDQLYSDPTSGESFPGWFVTSAGACSCMAGFRGSTSVWFPKKSWRIEVANPEIFGRSHFLFNAQYRDTSMVRNTIGLLLTEMLGFPAPQSEYVVFAINEASDGLYVLTERIDEFFFNRTGIPRGPTFKSVDSISRFAWLYSDTAATTGYDPKLNSEPYLSELHRLIDLVNTGSPLPLHENLFLAYYAVSYAIFDTDGICKNFYLIQDGSGFWRVIPWDRDATFGNDWHGDYNPAWIETTGLYNLDISSLSSRLLEDDAGRAAFAGYLNQTANLMETVLPGKIDSIRSLITPYIEADPLWQGTVDDFEDACDLLLDVLPLRAEFVRNVAWRFFPTAVEEMNLVMFSGSGNSVHVTLTTDNIADNVILACTFMDGTMQWRNMTPVSGGTEWQASVFFPDSQYAVFFTAGPLGVEGGNTSVARFYYPGYSLCDFANRPTASPALRRDLAPLEPEFLVPLVPVLYGPSLWTIPVYNSSGEYQDISLCCFAMKTGRVFIPESTLVQPEDTFFLTGRSDLLEIHLPGKQIFGNLTVDIQAGDRLSLIDPSWVTLADWVIVEADTLPSCNQPVISEICCQGPSGDWIEFYNPSESEMNLSSYYMIDSELNYTVLFPNSIVSPGGFLVVCEDQACFTEANPGVPNYTEGLDFGLDQESDGITLIDNTGNTVLEIAWCSENGWPLENDCVLALRWPSAPVRTSESWLACLQPGTPGFPNPGWPVSGNIASIGPVFPNPASASISFSYNIQVLPAEALLYDISGRLVMRMGLLDSIAGSFSTDLPDGLEPGIYFAVIHNRNLLISRKVTVLP